MSEQEARRLIARIYNKGTLDEIMELIAESKSRNKDLIPVLEAAAYQARLERLRQLQNEIDLVM